MKKIKKLRKGLVFTVLIASLLGGLLGTLFSQQTYAAPKAVNPLLSVGAKCHHMTKDSKQWKDCENWQHELSYTGSGTPSLKCDSHLFIERANPDDASAGTNDWYTDVNDFAQCYAKANVAVDLLSSNTCKKLVKGSDNWDKCENAQFALWRGLGCDDHMFKGVGDNKFEIFSDRVSNCKKRLAQIADLTLYKTDGTLTGKVSQLQGAQSGQVGTNGDNGGDDSSACVANGHTSLEWLLCPITTALGKAAEGINDIVEEQLDFETSQFLKDDGGVHQAWAILKNIVTAALVIIMLIMVFSQAVGGGAFDAYTIKKMLPRLAIAVIAMQLSWELCIWIINLINDLGHGIKQILAAPFGGEGNLDLNSLLNHLSGFWAEAANVGLAAGLVSAAILGSVFIPGALLIAFTVALAVLVAVATLLFRNVLIIACVIFAPVALLLWVLPNQSMQRYWKFWADNFSKLLLLFPLMISIIYAGRIFAWIAGDLGNSAGFLDFIMVVVGFFGPYFILPKAFQWGGSVMKAGASAIATNAAVRKGGEFGRKELGDWQKRRVDEQAKKLNPATNEFDYASAKRWKKIPYGWNGKLGKTMAANVRAGRYMPSKRSLATTIKRGDEWNAQEDAIATARLNRERDKAVTQGARKYSLDSNGKVVASDVTGTGAGKATLFSAMGSADDRVSGMALQRAWETNSSVEWNSNLVPIEDEGLKSRIRASGAEIFEDDPDGKGRIFVRPHDVPRYITKFNSNDDLYGMPMAKSTMSAPHIADSQLDSEGFTAAQRQVMSQSERDEIVAAKKAGRAPSVKPISHQAARAILTMRDYLDAGNITNQAESEIREFGRLAKQDSRVGDAWASLLERVGNGSQGGINALGQFLSSGSGTEAVNAVLAHASKKVPDLEGYLQAAKTKQQAAATPAGGGAPTTAPAAAASAAAAPGATGPAMPSRFTAPAYATSTGAPSAGGGTGGGGVSGGGATVSPGATQELTEAVKGLTRTMEEQRGRERKIQPGEIHIEHGPEIRGTGSRVAGTNIYLPQERRTRPPEEPTGQ